MKGVVLGVGVNDLRDTKGCPFYSRWQNMLKRCYSKSYQERQPSYIGCTVSAEWLVFSNFKMWMEKQDWEGKDLDKDIIFTGNKVYSLETCVFLDKKLNTFFSDRGCDRGEYPIGVGFHKPSGLYRARCGDGIGGRVTLGYFPTPQEAHYAWKSYKTDRLKALAEAQSDKRVILALATNSYF